MTPIAPGFTAHFVANPNVKFFPDANTVTWVSSDVTHAPVTQDPDNPLKASVTLTTTATVGATFTLTVSFTNIGGGAVSSHTVFTIVAPPVVTAFTILQSVS